MSCETGLLLRYGTVWGRGESMAHQHGTGTAAHTAGHHQRLLTTLVLTGTIFVAEVIGAAVT